MSSTSTFDEVLRRMESIRQEINSAVDDTLETVATETVGNIQTITPVDTGALRRSMTHSGVVNNGTSRSVKIGSALEYAPYVEDGHMQGSTYVPGRHMIRDSLTVAQYELENKVSNAINEIFDRYR